MTDELQKFTDDLVRVLKNLGIKPGDLLFIHADSIILAQYKNLASPKGFQALVDTLSGYLGPQGTLVMPTFTYSFTQGEDFHVLESASKVGIITEYFRKCEQVVRSLDPQFSVATKGKYAEDIRNIEVGECFGPYSIFGFLHRKKGKILGIGCSFDRTTFIHYIEKSVGVDYRFDKILSGHVIDSNENSYCQKITYYIRDLNRQTKIDLNRLKKYLIQKEKFRSTILGRFIIWTVNAHELYEEACLLLKTQPYALIKEGLS